MKRLNNEKGYALVTVLLIIVVFLIVFLSFMVQAFSSVKQNTIVESSSQSTAVAEAGIAFYKVAIQQIFESSGAEVNQVVNNNLNPLPGENIDQSAARKEAILATAEIIKRELQNEVPVTIEANNDAIFEIENISTAVNTDTNEVKVHFSVDGREGDSRPTTLEADVLLNLESIIVNQDSINFVLPTFEEVPRPETGCTSFTSGCDAILVDGSEPLPGKNDNNKGNNNGLSNKIAYSTDPDKVFTIGGNANNSVNLKIHSEGGFNIGSNMNGASNLTIETKKDATFEGNLKVDVGSRILVGGDIINGKHLDLDNRSFVYVGGDANIDKLDISIDSTMCVQGILTVNDFQLNKIDGNLFVKSEVGDEIFEQKCGSPSSINLTIKWGQNIEALVDRVKYK